jgi:hypothetical protein
MRNDLGWMFEASIVVVCAIAFVLVGFVSSLFF